MAAALIGSTAFAAFPSDVLAGPMSVADPAGVGLSAPVDTVHYRRYRRGYYRGYGYDPSGAIFAGAAAGLIGAGVAAATRPGYYGYGYPSYGYGYGYPSYYGYGYGYPGYYGGWGW